MPTDYDLFISSKMQELAHERQLLADFIPSLSDNLIKLKSWIFEKHAPATEDAIREVYLESLKNSALYIGLFWNQYGEWTIDEFERAGEWNISRHIYVKDVNADQRNDELKAFLEKVGNVEHGITAKWFKTDEELKDALKQSLTAWTRKHIIRRPGDLRARLFRSPHEIDELPEHFIGREAELQELAGLLGDKNVRILIQGFGGEGKTALAAKIAANYITDKASILWLRLGSSDLDTAYEALAAAFDANQEMAKAQGDAKRELFRALLQREKVDLVILDDAWDNTVLQSLSLATPRGIPLIVTARNHYRLGKMIELGGLLPDDAFKLLDTLSAGVDDQVKAYDIVEKLGYLAFAVEVAGHTMRENQWSSSEMLDRLQAPHTMEMPYEFRQSGRESVAVLLEQSILSLSTEARKTFQDLGAFFAPSISPELMALYQSTNNDKLSDFFIENNLDEFQRRALALLDLYHNTDKKEISIGAVESSLDELQRRALLRYTPANEKTNSFYKAHDLTYSYATAQNGDETRDKAVYACLAYIDHYNMPSLSNFAALIPELDNFMGAASFAMQQGFYDDVERFAWRLYAIGGSKVLDYLGYNKQAISLLKQAATAAEKTGKKLNQSAHLGNLGNIYSNIGELKLAIDYHKQSLEISREISDAEGEGNSLANLGIAYRMLGELQMAIDYLEKGLALHEKLGNKRRQGDQLSNLANAYHDMGQYLKAINYHNQSLEIKREVSNRRGEANSLGGLGNSYFSLGQLQHALEYYSQSLVIRREIGDRGGEASILGNLGNVYSALGKYEEGIESHQLSLEINREIGSKLGESGALNNLGTDYEHLKDYPKALAYYEQALILAKALNNPPAIDGIERNLARVREAAGQTSDNNKPKIDSKQLGQASNIDYLQQVLATARELADKQGEVSALDGLSKAYSSLGHYPKAIEYLEQVLAIGRDLGDRWIEGSTLSDIGIAYKNMRQYQKAIDYQTQSMAIAKELGERQGEASVLQCLGVVYGDMGNFIVAIDYFEQALVINKELDNRYAIKQIEGNLAKARTLATRGNQAIQSGFITVPLNPAMLHQQTIDFYKQELGTAREVGNREKEANHLGNLGLAYNRLREYEQAIDYYKQALAISRELNNKSLEATTLGNLGGAYYLLEQIEQAIDYHKQALEIAKGISDSQGTANHLFNLGLAYEHLKDYPSAVSYYEQALVFMKTLRNPRIIQQTESNLARVLEAMKKGSREKEPIKPDNKKRWQFWKR
jgi:tetratricopeptide (TPR) repeat protein